MRRIFALLTLSLLTTLLALPASASPRSTNPPASSLIGHVSDSQLESTIRTKLAKSKIGKDGFRFHVVHGVVTWEGNTAIAQHKGAATRMARTSGATEVVNKIQVTGVGKPSGPLKKAFVQP